jgi:hypothetical protein
MTRTRALAAAAAFLATILAANWATTRYGMVPVGFGLAATAGTYFAGLSFVLRDSLQDTTHPGTPPRTLRDRLHAARWVLATIAAGAILSLVLALTIYRADAAHLPPGVTPTAIALASGAAFLIAETADLAVYTPLRRRGYIRAALASNVVGAVVDTLVFLWVAGFPIGPSFPGQLVGKLTITAVVVVVVKVVTARAVSGEPVQPRPQPAGRGSNA